MNDRPTLTELLDAVRQHLEREIVPMTKATNHRLYFQTLVAVNVLKIAERELAHSAQHQRQEWERLNHLLGETSPLPEATEAREIALSTRNHHLCEAIRRGEYDTSAELFAHLVQTTQEQLLIANPKYLASL